MIYINSNVKTIKELQEKIERLLVVLADNINDDYYSKNTHGDILCLKKSNLVTFDSPIGDATPFIEVKNGQFNFIISERGVEYKRIIGDADNVMF